MPIVLNGTTGVTAAAFDGAIDGADITTGNIPAARITDALGATGSAPIFACRAWVNFNGTGTPAIRASGNVSSITDNGVGDYTVNFTTAMPDANYAFLGTVANQHDGGFANAVIARDLSDTQSTTALRLTVREGSTAIDVPVACVSIFR